MTYISDDRWTCPTCGHVYAPEVPAQMRVQRIRAYQVAHGKLHAHEKPLARVRRLPRPRKAA